MTPLDVGSHTGGDRLLLWLPMTITHTIDDNSPLARWMDSKDAALQDDDSTIVVVVSQKHSPLRMPQRHNGIGLLSPSSIYPRLSLLRMNMFGC